jgi:MFS family permease
MKTLELIRDKISWKTTGSSIFLVFNSFVWYIFTYSLFSEILNESVLPQTAITLYSIYFISVAITAVVGAKIFPRFRVKALMAWIFFGSISTALLFSISYESFLINGLIVGLLGASVGIGLPSCLSFFADITKIENRSFIGGVIWSLVGVFVLGFAFLFNMLGIGVEMIILLVVWRIFGVLGFRLLNKNYERSEVQEAPSYLELIRDKKILLYLFPWIMFSIINFSLAPIVENVIGNDFFLIMQLITWFLVGIFAIIGGYIADIVGRKRVVIAGFVMLGIEYAAMSSFSNSTIATYMFMILDGTTWGLLLSVFFMSLWGDLGQYNVKEKYYVLGGLPYLLANFLYILIKPQVVDIIPSSAFTYASFFLFLAILPLVYAPETLPEKKIKERELKNYLENAQKIKNKYS